MENFTYGKALKKMGVNYLGAVANSAKINLSLKKGTMTYCVYLAPATMAGTINGKQINVCPNSKWCKDFCLNGSGRNRGDILLHEEKKEVSHINKARIKKTRFFYEDRETYMQVLVHEIKKAKRRADRLGYEFSVRLNGTSDISPEEMIVKGEVRDYNILEIFPEVKFYDYCKVYSRMALEKKYPNYSLTYSFNGHNKVACKKVLENGGNVAVVFYNETQLPKTYMGYEVINGNESDIRYKDKKGCVVGLHYHRTAHDYKKVNGKNVFVKPETKFVVFDDDPDVVF